MFPLGHWFSELDDVIRPPFYANLSSPETRPTRSPHLGSLLLKVNPSAKWKQKGDKSSAGKSGDGTILQLRKRNARGMGRACRRLLSAGAAVGVAGRRARRSGGPGARGGECAEVCRLRRQAELHRDGGDAAPLAVHHGVRDAEPSTNGARAHPLGQELEHTLLLRSKPGG